MIAPSFESHQCLAGMWKRRLGCHAGCREVSRCCTRGESQLMCNVTHTPPLSSGFDTQRRHHQKSKTGVSVAPQKGLMSSKNLKKKKKVSLTLSKSLGVLFIATTYTSILTVLHAALTPLFVAISSLLLVSV